MADRNTRTPSTPDASKHDLSSEEALRSAPPGSGIIDSSRSGQEVSENPASRVDHEPVVRHETGEGTHHVSDGGAEGR